MIYARQLRFLYFYAMSSEICILLCVQIASIHVHRQRRMDVKSEAKRCNEIKSNWIEAVGISSQVTTRWMLLDASRTFGAPFCTRFFLRLKWSHLRCNETRRENALERDSHANCWCQCVDILPNETNHFFARKTMLFGCRKQQPNRETQLEMNEICINHKCHF